MFAIEQITQNFDGDKYSDAKREAEFVAADRRNIYIKLITIS
jgi:hypothetical protein